MPLISKATLAITSLAFIFADVPGHRLVHIYQELIMVFPIYLLPGRLFQWRPFFCFDNLPVSAFALAAASFTMAYAFT
jgi:hypothetical protein